MSENNSIDKQIQEMLEFVSTDRIDIAGPANRETSNLFWVTEIENTVDSIETAVAFLDRRDEYKWKWISFALHHALYSLCIATLVHGNYGVVLKSQGNDDKHYFRRGLEDKWKKSKIVRRDNSPYYTIEWIEIEDNPPQVESKPNKKPKKGHLISFWSALARVQDQEYWMGRLHGIKALKLSESQANNIIWLVVDVRNDLMHFIPKSYGISIDDLKAAFIDIIEVIEFLAFESSPFLFSFKPEVERPLKEAINNIKQKINT
jgi:hypothetical protein